MLLHTVYVTCFPDFEKCNTPEVPLHLKVKAVLMAVLSALHYSAQLTRGKENNKDREEEWLPSCFCADILPLLPCYTDRWSGWDYIEQEWRGWGHKISSWDLKVVRVTDKLPAANCLRLQYSVGAGGNIELRQLDLVVRKLVVTKNDPYRKLTFLLAVVKSINTFKLIPIERYVIMLYYASLTYNNNANLLVEKIST